MPVFIEKNKTGIIRLIYLIVFIYTVIIRRYSFHEIIIALALVTVFITIICFSGFLGLLGNFFYATNNMEKSQAYLHKAIKRGTTQPTVYLNYAILLLKENKAEQALEYLEKARVINRKISTDQNISLTIASCYLLLGKNSEAAQTAEELQIHYERLSPHAKEIIAYCYFKNAQYDKALEIGLPSANTNSSAASWETLAMVYYKTGDFEKAKDCFLKALEIDKLLIDSNFYLGEIFSLENEIDKAEFYYGKALKSPLSPFSIINISVVKEKIDELKKSEETF